MFSFQCHPSKCVRLFGNTFFRKGKRKVALQHFYATQCVTTRSGDIKMGEGKKRDRSYLNADIMGLVGGRRRKNNTKKN
jgi:hypothetical protein